jgi:hypothetical protein
MPSQSGKAVLVPALIAAAVVARWLFDRPSIRHVLPSRDAAMPAALRFSR